jgi:hypothetical protein
MLKTITKNMFDITAAVMMIAVVFYLAAVTHIMPLPDSALRRLSNASLDVMNVIFACAASVIRLFVH